MMVEAKLRTIHEVVEPTGETTPANTGAENIAARMISLALMTVGKKFVIALSTLFTLALAASVFWIFWSVCAEPTAPKLIGAGVYAAFALTLTWMKRP